MIKINKFFKNIVNRAVSCLCAFGFSVAPLVSALPAPVASADVTNGINMSMAMWRINTVNRADGLPSGNIASTPADAFAEFDNVYFMDYGSGYNLRMIDFLQVGGRIYHVGDGSGTGSQNWLQYYYTRSGSTTQYFSYYNYYNGVGNERPWSYYNSGISTNYGSVFFVGDGVILPSLYTYFHTVGELVTEPESISLEYENDFFTIPSPELSDPGTVRETLWILDYGTENQSFLLNSDVVLQNNNYSTVSAMVLYSSGYSYWFSDPRGAGGDYTPVIEYENGVIVWEDVNPGGVDVDYDIYDLTDGTIIAETSQTEWTVPEFRYGHDFSVRANVYLVDGTVISDWSNVITADAPPDGGWPAVQLDAPVLSQTSDLLFWNSVRNADYYDLQILDGTNWVHYYYLTGTTFNTTFSGSFRVIARSNNPSYSASEPSNVIQFILGDFTLTQPLLSYNGSSNNLIWTSVSGAVSYRILRDGALLVSGLTELQYPLPMGFGSYNVVAVDADGNIGPASNTIAITPDSNDSPYAIGYREGYEKGKTYGYQKGFDEGSEEDQFVLGFFKGVIDVPINAGRSLLNWDFFGFNVGDMFRSILSILFVLAVAKLVMYFM